MKLEHIASFSELEQYIKKNYQQLFLAQRVIAYPNSFYLEMKRRHCIEYLGTRYKLHPKYVANDTPVLHSRLVV